MQAVESKYRSFPWAFTYPDPEEGSTHSEMIGEINRWLLDHDLKFNRDYLHFEFSEKLRFGGLSLGESVKMAVAFKDNGKAVLFKLAWA